MRSLSLANSSWMRFKAVAALMALAVVVTGLGLAPSGTAVAATTLTPTSTILPVRQCAKLVKDFALPGTTAHVTAATLVASSASTPEHCDVRGYIEPAVQFQLRLPTTTYTGRYLQYGCGGFCGVVLTPPFPDCGGPQPSDMAVAATDDGHVGYGVIPQDDGKWAADNQAARDDWAYRAPHVLSLGSKQIIAFYYGAPPTRSYFTGCSNGGREALLLVQRYPNDFDGVIAAAPADYFSPLVVYQAWLARSNIAADGTPIITSAKLPALHDAVVAACDRLDGLVDGQIDDPRACRFDPVAVQCPTGRDQASCLTPAQVDAARKLYAGPTDPDGQRLYPGGQPRGSELAWYPWLIPAPELLDSSIAFDLADNYLRYVGYPIGTPHSSLAEFAFTVPEFDRLTPEGVKINAMSLDLREFQRSGGKLLLWHGWADEGIPPVGTLDYYQRLQQRSGGLQKTQEWARLFMVPTIYHCGLGYRLTEFNPFRELVDWVERGKAPERVIANQRDAQGSVVRSRPVFPYPLHAKYDGTGSIDDASNFVPEQPSTPPHDTIPWVGTDLYAKPGPVAPG
jgi:feruloyl esterase